MSRAVITGVGLLTPLGNSVAQTWDAMLAGRYIIDHANVPLEFSDRIPRVSHLAILAAREAIAASSSSWQGNDTALVIGTSKGPIENWLSSTGVVLPSLRAEEGIGKDTQDSSVSGLLKAPSRLSDVKGPSDFGLAETANDVANVLGLHGPRLTVSAACASGLHALIRGTMLIQSGEARRVLVVAAEASVHPLFLASFARLGVLPAKEMGCRPFDQKRDGFLMSEAAAAVCLEAETDCRADVVVDRFALGADASHLTAGDATGIPLTRIIQQVVRGHPVDLVHAHGTGTVTNDPAELAAIERSLADQSSPSAMYSHKGALGHSLGAAGLVSVVINVMSHQMGIVPPNVRTTQPLPMTKVRMNQSISYRDVQRSIAIAAGFGGALAAISLLSRE
jgi:3-oxoacyl-[acyl-carrier-protein] synthase II